MALRYRRRLSLGPFRINVSRSGVSASTKLGPVTVNSKGRTYVNLPGGLFWTGRTRRG